ncbi:protein phosphatase CheZ [Glaciimonas sp. PAMC28666]|uniref:protein phosphatase CheZ n=1 Tax=Glaciimonas sp. PAMC28666 TaxID=2807626 RepID=UPI0019658C28|nr:protein phosphatase CheZ [Glaciimonas sp. PAMC28666]QRX83173.1 protein phosphatase CheZ [Glaciimonas sp. PAMC28666]
MSPTALSMPNVPVAADTAEQLVSRIGRMTRLLRESMRELGLDQEIAKAAQAIPDARERLTYVAAMTERAAERALNAIDVAQPIQDQMAQQARQLNNRWDAWFANPVELEHARALVLDTRGYLQEVPKQAAAINAQLIEIMMAQDFQDLTGQVIKKMTEVVLHIEKQLLQVLIDNAPTDSRHDAAVVSPASNLLFGPQVSVVTSSDAVSDQEQVDDLLASMGF